MEGTIRVTASAKGTITASGVRLHLRLEGERAVFGNAALQQSRELRELVTRLKGLGLEESAISLAAVSFTGPSGALKASRAEFHLVIAEAALERLPLLLGALSDTKNAELRSLEWIWDDFEASLPLVAEAMKRAQRKAERMASAVKARVIGVRNASDTWDIPESRVNYQGMTVQSKLTSRSRDASMQIGMEYRAEQPLEVTVTVDFAVQNAANSAS